MSIQVSTSETFVPLQTSPCWALHYPTGGGCRKSSRPRGARLGAAGAHPHTSRPIGLRAPLAAANCANLVRIFSKRSHVCCEQAGVNVGQIHRHQRAAPQRAQCRNSVRVVFLQGLSRAQDSGLTLILQLPTVKNTLLDKGHLDVAVPRVFSVRTHESSKPRRQSMKVGMHPGNSFGTKATGCIR